MLDQNGIPLGSREHVDVHALGPRRFHLHRWLLFLRLSPFREQIKNAHRALSPEKAVGITIDSRAVHCGVDKQAGSSPWLAFSACWPS
jgi:hypothetical protein